MVALADRNRGYRSDRDISLILGCSLSTRCNPGLVNRDRHVLASFTFLETISLPAEANELWATSIGVFSWVACPHNPSLIPYLWLKISNW
jgi:hypothetical protein